MSIVNPFRLGFPALPPALREYNRDNEANFRLAVEQLLKQVVSATNTTANSSNLFESVLQFRPDNTVDVGDITGPYRPRTVYGATSVVTPTLESGGAFNLVLRRNNVAQLTLGSLAATFAGSLAVTTNLTVGGNTALGDTTSDTITANGVFQTSVLLANSVYQQFGMTNPAQSGFLRFRHDPGDLLTVRNSGNSADVSILRVEGAQNSVRFGQTAGIGEMIMYFTSGNGLRPFDDGLNDLGSNASEWRNVFARTLTLSQVLGGSSGAAATNGTLNFANNFTVYARNAANSADLLMLWLDTGNNVWLGTGAPTNIRIGADAGTNNYWLNLTSNGLELPNTDINTLRYSSIAAGQKYTVKVRGGSRASPSRWQGGTLFSLEGSADSTGAATYVDAGKFQMVTDDIATIGGMNSYWRLSATYGAVESNCMFVYGSGDVTVGSTLATVRGSGWLTAKGGLASDILDTATNTNLLLKRNAVTQLTLASLAATFAGDVTVSGDNLNVNGLTYTWPSSQSANRVLRNTGPGTLAWSQVDLSTDVTGSMSGGTVPASQVTAGTFPGTTYAWSDAAMSLTYVAGTGLQGEFGFYGGGGLGIYDGGYLFYEGTGIAGGVAIIINGDNATAQPAIAWQTGGVQKFATFINSSNKLALGHGSFTTDLTLDSAGLFAFQNAVDFMAAIRVLGNVYTSRIDTATAGAGDLTLWRNGVSKLTLGNALANFADPISGPALYSTILDSNGASDLLLKYNAITVLTLNTTTATFSGSVTTTELFSPTVDSGSTTDLILQRNNVTQLTLASSVATFVGSVQGTTVIGTTRVTAPLLGTTSNVDTVLDRNSVTRLTLGSSTSTFAGPLAITGALSGVTTLAISDDLTYSDTSWVMAANTADAADTSRAFFAGGGAAATGRGSYVGVHGQEHATNPGELYLIAGNAGFIRTFGTVRPDSDNANDLGTSSVRYKTGYLGTSLVIATDPTGTQALRVGGLTHLLSTTANQLRLAYSTSQYWDMNVTSVGGLELLPTGTTFNLALFAAGSYGSGKGVVFIANATTVPSTNPTGGGILYCESGALKYRGSSGTVTTLGPA